MFKRLQHWFWQRLPRSDSTHLKQRNLYVLPTGAGLLLLATLLVLLIASINYQLNLGYLLTFLIAGCAAVSVYMAHSTLRGLQLQLRAPAPQYANAPVLLDITIHNPSSRPRWAVGLRVGERYTLFATKKTQKKRKKINLYDQLNWYSCPARANQTAQLSWLCGQRGWHELPAIHIETRFPMGIFRVWSVWRPAAAVLLYPTPEATPPNLPVQTSHTMQDEAASISNTNVRQASDEIPQDIRPYQRGDAPRHMAWKKIAQTGELYTRENQQPAQLNLWLNFDVANASSIGQEPALQRLCAWVQMASRANHHFGLQLPAAANKPAVTISPHSGEAHTQSCLQALAEWGQ